MKSGPNPLAFRLFCFALCAVFVFIFFLSHMEFRARCVKHHPTLNLRQDVLNEIPYGI